MDNNGSPGADSARLRAGASRTRRWAVGAFVAIVCMAGGAVAAWWWSRPPQSVQRAAIPDAEIDEWSEAAAMAPGYLGVQACAGCHAKRVAEFKATRHFLACRAPRPGEMPGGFDPGKGTYATREKALQFEMTQTGDAFLQTAIHSEPAGEKRTPARIALAYGAGGVLDEVYFTWHGDRLRELPMVWLHPLNRWAMISYSQHAGQGDYSRETTTRCLECHNTWVEHVPGTRNQYKRDSFILGVTCEKCHGPGQDHVAFHQAHPEADAGHAVVNPGLLTRERRLEVCTQCHSNAIHSRTRAFRYRPGEPLDDFFRTIPTRHPEQDHVANQGQYLRQSKCFQKSETLTCTTCHNPHRPHEPGKAGSSERSCLKCHKSADCAEQERLPSAVRSNCVGCHMSARVWMNVHFHTEDDQYVPPIRRYQHRIAVDPVARQEVLLAWHRTQSDALSRHEADRLTKALAEHWLAEAETRRRDFRFLAAIGALREAMRVDPSAATREKLRQAVALQANLDADLVLAMYEIDQRRFAPAIAALNRVLAIKPDQAVAHGKLGTAYAASGKNELAVKHLRAGIEHDPNDPYGYMMLGWLAYLDGKGEDAVDAYRRADQRDPFNAKTHYHWGLALAKFGQVPEAVEHFRQVLTIDPDHAGACLALGDLLRQQGEPIEAVRFAKRAARLTQDQNPEILMSLADAYADARRFGDAATAAAKALDAAQKSSPPMAPQIRWRLDEWRLLAKKAGQ